MREGISVSISMVKVWEWVVDDDRSREATDPTFKSGVLR